jgi:hypothetical protein
MRSQFYQPGLRAQTATQYFFITIKYLLAQTRLDTRPAGERRQARPATSGVCRSRASRCFDRASGERVYGARSA